MVSLLVETTHVIKEPLTETHIGNPFPAQTDKWLTPIPNL